MAEREWSIDWQDEELQRKVREAPQLLFLNIHSAMSEMALRHVFGLLKMHRASPATEGLVPVKNKTDSLSNFGGLLGDTSQGYRVSPERTKGKGATVRLDTLKMDRWIGRGLPYAHIHEEGGEITPKRSKVLTIPTRHARTQAGRSKGSIKDFSGHWVSTKSKTTGAKVLLFLEDGTDLPLFVGVTRVTIPPRLKFQSSWDDQQEAGDRLMVKAVDMAMSGRRLAPKASQKGDQN